MDITLVITSASWDIKSFNYGYITTLFIGMIAPNYMGLSEIGAPHGLMKVMTPWNCHLVGGLEHVL